MPTVTGCEFVYCDGSADRGVSVRGFASDVWEVWPVCGQHVRVLTGDLRGMGLVVSGDYPLFGALCEVMRARAEAAYPVAS